MLHRLLDAISLLLTVFPNPLLSQLLITLPPRKAKARKQTFLTHKLKGTSFSELQNQTQGFLTALNKSILGCAWTTFLVGELLGLSFSDGTQYRYASVIEDHKDLTDCSLTTANAERTLLWL